MKLDVNKNAKRNIAVGLINKSILLFLPFITRTIINQVLGTAYLGLNSLFTSILSVLSLSELGFSSAMVYHMYKPIAENDISTINALLNLYKKAYIVIGSVISVIGISLVPFLDSIINDNTNLGVNILYIYMLQLINVTISYFMYGYKQSLLVAYQRDDINYVINLVTQLGLQIVQIILLLSTKNYYFYIICIPCFTVLNNLWVAYYIKKLYPYIICEGVVNNQTKASIKKLVMGSFIQKACDTTRNSLDSICISAFISLSVTGIYNNYYLIFNAINTLLTVFISSIVGGIGNHVVHKNSEENFEELKKMDFLYMMLSGMCVTCLLCLSQTFMKIWMGEDMLLTMFSLVSMCVYFYVLKLGDVRSVYYSATGIYWEMRYRSIVETILNFVLNIWLGRAFGLNGIIWATTISLLVINFTWGSYIMFKHYFGIAKLVEYFLYQIKYCTITIFVCVIVFYVCDKLSLYNSVIELILKLVCCVFLGGGLFIVMNYYNPVFKQAISMIKK